MLDAELLIQLPVFRNLSREEATVLSGLCMLRTVRQNEVVFRPGDNRNAFFVVYTGQIRITRVLNDEVQTLAMLDPYDFAVESALVDPNLKHEHTGEAVVESQLVEIDGKQFHAFLQQYPQIANQMFRQIILNLSERLHHANNKLGTIYATGKIAAGYSNLENVTDLLLTTILSIIHAKRALFALYKPREGMAVVRQAMGYGNDQKIRNLSVPLHSDPILGAMHNTGADIVISEEDYKQNKTLHTPYASRNMLGVPLQVGGRMVGAILLGDKVNAKSFSHNNQILLDIIARQIVLLVAAGELGEERR